MGNIETVEMITGVRTVTAAAILENRADLRGYPYQYLAVGSQGWNGVRRMADALAAAEVLSRFGWDLVNMAEFSESKTVFAFLRRRGTLG